MKKSKQKEGGRGLLSQKISNRLSYTIIALVGLMLVGVFVFAIAPNPGHDYRDLDLGPITINGGTSYVSVEIDRAVEAEMFRATGGYCIVDDCITSWPSGGGGTPTLSEVLTAGNTASTLINMNNKDFSNVGTLNLANTGKINADDGQVEVEGKLNVGTGDLNVRGKITASYGNVIIDSNIDLTDGNLLDANTVQANILEDPEDDTLVIDDDLSLNGHIITNGYIRTWDCQYTAEYCGGQVMKCPSNKYLAGIEIHSNGCMRGYCCRP